MKKSLIIICFMLTIFNAKAQEIRYDTCNNVQQYEGEWRYINGNDTIRITLRYNRDYSTTIKYVKDVLYGWFEYKHGNTVVAGDYGNRNSTLSYNYDSRFANIGSIRLRLWDCENVFVLRGEITEIQNVCNRSLNVKATLNSAKTIMTWHQEYGERFTSCPMIMPRDFVLIKQ